MLTADDWQALWLTVRLAGLVTLILFIVGTPIAWWLARSILAALHGAAAANRL